jgi:hypothetical protein
MTSTYHKGTDGTYAKSRLVSYSATKEGSATYSSILANIEKSKGEAMTYKCGLGSLTMGPDGVKYEGPTPKKTEGKGIKRKGCSRCNVMRNLPSSKLYLSLQNLPLQFCHSNFATVLRHEHSHVRVRKPEQAESRERPHLEKGRQ